MTDAQRVLTAIHEASHCAMARLVRVPIGPASIRPTEHLLGFAYTGRPLRVRPVDLDAVTLLPAPLWPAGVRRQVECQIMVLLAGRIGETFVLGPSSKYFDESDDVRALELAEQLAVTPKPSALSPEDRRLLAIAEQGGPRAGDDATALELARLIGATDNAEAHAYLHWLRIVTARRMYTAFRFREQVEALADALLEHEVMGWRRIRATLETAARDDAYERFATRARKG